MIVEKLPKGSRKVISVRVGKRVYEVLQVLASRNGMSLYEYVRKVLLGHVSAYVSSEVSYHQVNYQSLLLNNCRNGAILLAPGLARKYLICLGEL